jgi:hypothetical protein
MNPKVLVVTPEFLPDVGGVGRSVARLCSFLPRIGYTPVVLVIRYGERAAVPARVVSEAVGFKLSVWQAWFERSDASPASVQRVTRQARAHVRHVVELERPALAHLFYLSHRASVAAGVCVERGVPYVASARGSDVNLGFANPARRPLLESICAHAAAVTAMNRLMLRRLDELLLGRPVPATVVYHSLWPAAYALEAADDPGVPVGRPRVGAVVTHPEKKGLPCLAGLSRGDAPWTLSLLAPRRALVAGEVGQTLAAGGAEVTSLAPADVLPWYRRLAAYVQASPAEGGPNSLLEAIHCGVPTVCTRAGAAADLLEEGVSTLFVPTGDVAALWRALSRLLSDPALARELTNNARLALQRECTPEVELDRWRAVYESIDSRARDGSAARLLAGSAGHP